MATAAASADYAQDAIEFARDLEEDGYQCSFGKKGARVNDWDPPGEYTETGKAFVFPGEWKADFSNDVRADDLMFFVSALIDLEDCTHMIDTGTQRTIVHIKPFRPDGVTTIYYEIQTR